MAADAADSRLPLALRIFLLAGVLVALTAGVAALAAHLVGERVARETVDRALAGSMEAQRRVLRQRLDLLERTGRLLAADAAFVGEVAAAAGADLDPDGAPDSVLLQERRAQLGFDLGIVLDADGALLLRAGVEDDGGDAWRADPLVARALAEPGIARGLWRHRGQLYHAAIVPLPLPQGQVPVEWLLLAQRVDDALGREIAHGTGAEIAFWLPSEDGPRLVASSLAEPQARALEAAFAADPELDDALQLGRTIEGRRMALGDEEWLLRLAPAGRDGVGDSGAVAALASFSAAGSGYRQLLDLVLLAAAGVLALALPLSWWLSGRILRPVGGLADAAERAAAGDYHGEVAGAGGGLTRLARALDALLSELREKRALEDYIATYSRFLPDLQEPPAPPEPAAAAPPAARRGASVLLGLEFAPLPEDGPAADALARARQRAVQLEQLAGACGGRVLSGDGERWTLGFDGDQRIEHALQAARAVLSGGDEAPAAALAEGELASGGFGSISPAAHAVLGTPARQLLRLLCESAPGRALVARPLGERVRERFGGAALQVASGALAGRRYYALQLTGLDALPVAEPAAAPDGEGVELHAGATMASGATPDRWPRGERVAGRYEILSVLGADAMGVDYKARDLEHADVVVLKALQQDASPEPERAARLEEAIRLARRVSHPNVLRSFDAGADDGFAWVAMDYVRGVSLRALLDQSGRLPFAAGLRIARQLCAGLAAAHAAGVLHRDIRPGNLVLEAGGNARLSGFGIARPARHHRGEPPRPGMPAGTPHYSAPEQLAGEEADDRADIYACGALMSEMFCGGLPYAGDTATEVYLAQVQQEPVRPSSLWADVPPTLERIILRCIARRREDRFQSAVELHEALAELRA